MFAGFETFDIQTSGARIHGVVGGSGPPVLLLHGYPQTHVMWHKLAARLAEELTVVATDLRGYGDSEKPASGADHAAYSKRSMGRDQAEVMKALGHERFSLVGHDRGGRVGHRLALDAPERIERLVVLDIAPTYMLFKTADQEFATAYYHWFFLIQPFDLPERLIGADVEFWLRSKVAQWGRDSGAVTAEAFAEYLRCFRDPATIHASCEDYRAAATIDLQDDETDLGTKLKCPVLALWGNKGFIGRKYDVLGAWRERAEQVKGRGIPCGHFLPEEEPDETLAEVRKFLLET